MKITEEHFAIIVAAIKAAQEKISLVDRMVESSRSALTCKWTMIRHGMILTDQIQLFDDLYIYVNDTHIETALNRAFTLLGIEQ